MTRIPWTALALTLAACGAPPPPSDDGRTSTSGDTNAAEEAAILQTVDRFMHAISTRDAALMKELQVAEGTTFVERVVDGEKRIVRRPNSYYTDPARANSDQYLERYWNPTVHIRGGIAVVWTPYEFWINGRTSHCGIDSFDMVKIDGQWRIGNAMWTVEPDACEALRPSDPSAIRPAKAP